MDALEPSSKMLELAKKRKIYKRHMCEYLGPKKLDIDNGTLKLRLHDDLVYFHCIVDTCGLMY